MELVARQFTHPSDLVGVDRLPLAALERFEQLLLVWIELHDRPIGTMGPSNRERTIRVGPRGLRDETATVEKTVAIAVRSLCPDDPKIRPSKTNADDLRHLVELLAWPVSNAP